MANICYLSSSDSLLEAPPLSLSFLLMLVSSLYFLQNLAKEKDLILVIYTLVEM